MTLTQALIVAAVAGSLMAWQGTINSLLSEGISLAYATLVVHVTGTIAAAVIALTVYLTGSVSTDLGDMFSSPWYAYVGGILGVAIIWGVAATIARTGAAPATTAIIVGQVATAAMLDHFGAFHLERTPFSVARGIGLALLTAGAWLMLHRG